MKQDPLMTNTATSHLMSHLATTTKLTHITIFSDGASSTYHASECIVATPSVARHSGMTVRAWNFFESQARILHMAERQPCMCLSVFLQLLDGKMQIGHLCMAVFLTCFHFAWWMDLKWFTRFQATLISSYRYIQG